MKIAYKNLLIKLPRWKIPEYFQKIENQDVALKFTKRKSPNTIALTNAFFLVIYLLLCTCRPLIMRLPFPVLQTRNVVVNYNQGKLFSFVLLSM